MTTTRWFTTSVLVFVLAVGLAIAPVSSAQAATQNFPCTYIKLSHQWERSCKGTAARTGSKVSGIAYRVFKSRAVPGLSSYAEISVKLTDTAPDGKCAWLRINTQARGNIWLASCNNGHTESLRWVDSGIAGDWIHAYVCTAKSTSSCTHFWYQDMTTAGPAGTF